MKLTEDDIQCESLISDSLAMKTIIIQYFGKPEDGKELKQQILQDQKLRELCEKHSKHLDLTIASICEEMLKDSKK